MNYLYLLWNKKNDILIKKKKVPKKRGGCDGHRVSKVILAFGFGLSYVAFNHKLGESKVLLFAAEKTENKNK